LTQKGKWSVGKYRPVKGRESDKHTEEEKEGRDPQEAPHFQHVLGGPVNPKKKKQGKKEKNGNGEAPGKSRRSRTGDSPGSHSRDLTYRGTSWGKFKAGRKDRLVRARGKNLREAKRSLKG